MKKIALPLFIALVMTLSCSEDSSDTNENIDSSPSQEQTQENLPETTNENNNSTPEPTKTVSQEVSGEVSDNFDTDIPQLDSSWQLVFTEDFASNLDQWFIWEGGAFNDEIQLYRNEQLSLENGILTIAAKREAVKGANNIFDDTEKSFDYVSGRIHTVKQFGPTDTEGDRIYRIMSRIKLPTGNGMWPAFWSFADPWPTLGELDFFEARGNAGNKLETNIFYGTEPGKVITKQRDTKMKYNSPLDLRQDFHTYEALWSKSGLTLKVDNVTYAEYTASNLNGLTQMFGSKHNIILNLAVGGVFFKNINPATFINNSTMEIDWVRVYKK